MNKTDNKTVLIIDDEPNVQIYLKTILEDHGFNTVLAGNGKQALDQIKKKKPDVISLDLVMPKMTGLKFFRYVKGNKIVDGVPFVVVTAHSKDEMGQKDIQELQKEALKSVIYFLEKPVNPLEYANTIREALGLAKPKPHKKSDECEDLKNKIKNKILDANKEKLLKVLKALG
ncbi:MAG: response regulator [Deltaproteobacteria bacterium]|nr:response regulator [Deltaproteobacteria bacterium]